MRQVLFSNVSPMEAIKMSAFKSPTDAEVTLTFYGSCYSAKAGVMTGISVLIDSKVV